MPTEPFAGFLQEENRHQVLEVTAYGIETKAEQRSGEPLLKRTPNPNLEKQNKQTTKPLSVDTHETEF